MLENFLGSYVGGFNLTKATVGNLDINDQMLVQFDTATLQTDQFDFTLPQGYVPDELPPPVKVEYDFATYSSNVEMISANVMRYTRTYQVKDVMVPTSRRGDLKRFFRQILTDESSAAVFKKVGP